MSRGLFKIISFLGRLGGIAGAISLALLAGSSPRALHAQEPTAAHPPRTIHFPALSIGELSACPADSDDERDCRLLGPAREAVQIPEGFRVSLRLPLFGVVDRGALAVLRPDDLWELNLTYMQVTAEDMRQISRLTGLERLILSSTNVNDAALAHLAQLTRLKRLDLARSAEFTDAGLDALTGLPLEEINLFGATKITNAGVEKLSTMPTLHQLTLCFTGADELCLGSLQRLPNLERLAFFNGVSDWGAPTFRFFPALKRLDLLEADGVTNQGLAQLAQCATLEELNLKSVKVDDAGLRAIAQAPKLKTVFLMRSKVTPAALSEIRAKRPDLKIYW